MLQLPSRKTKVTHFWILEVQFFLPTQHPFLWMSKGNDELHKCVNSSCIRKRQSKDYVILQFRSYFSCLWIVLAVDGQGGQQTPVLFWSWPMTGCMTFTSHLMSLSLFAKWAWKALLPCLSQTVASSGKVNGAVRQSGLLVALCQITVHPVVHNMNKAKMRWRMMSRSNKRHQRNICHLSSFCVNEDVIIQK